MSKEVDDASEVDTRGFPLPSTYTRTQVHIRTYKCIKRLASLAFFFHRQLKKELASHSFPKPSLTG